MLRMYIKKRSGEQKRIGYLKYKKIDYESLLDELIRIFSIKPSLLDEIESLMLYNEKVCILIDRKTVREILTPSAKAIHEIRRNSVFDNKSYNLLEKILDGRLDLKSIKRSIGRNAFHSKMIFLEKPAIYSGNTEIISARDSYEVLCYNVYIIENKTPEKMYVVRLFSSYAGIRFSYDSLGRILVMYDRKYFLRKISTAFFDEIMDHRLSLFHNIAQRFCPDILSELTKIEFRKLAYLSFFSSLKMTRIMPFLLDDKVQEFYQDAPSTKIYLDHEKYGRCVSNIALSSRELDAFLSHVKIDTGSYISFSSPSLKTDYRTTLFRVRVSIDSPPLTVNGIAIDVRKYGKKPLTLVDIVNKKTLTADAAAFLLTATIFRSNILICGEPGSGKTTLLNALDMLLPRTLRKVYIEDVVESVDQLSEGKHQLRLKVGTLEEIHENLSGKVLEIIKMLHRKPDYLILGELQNEEHVKAAFHAMNAGLRCIQTTHAYSLEQLIYRYVDIFSIPSRLLLSLDLIIFMKRDFYRGDKREVVSIFERHNHVADVNPLSFFKPIFIRRFNGLLERVSSYENSSLIEKISIENRISKNELILFIKKIESMIKQQQVAGIEALLNKLLFLKCKYEN
ncbi:MAG: hypothetical protein DRJ38_01680 [Thermoprotei archaeon]|nr:MAG: hypothetical protein DRJ38_01680 [Thermoprotei archaeon]